MSQNEKQAEAIVQGKNQGRALWHLGALMNFKALGTETGGRYWAVEGLADKAMAVPMHIHHTEDEFWYVLEGEVRFFIGDAVQSGGPGTFVHIPHGVTHSFQVISDTARWFGVGTPAILDQWFFETGEPATSLTLPPPADGPPDIEMIVNSLKTYDTETVGPPPDMND